MYIIIFIPVNGMRILSVQLTNIIHKRYQNLRPLKAAFIFLIKVDSKTLVQKIWLKQCITNLEIETLRIFFFI